MYRIYLVERIIPVTVHVTPHRLRCYLNGYFLNWMIMNHAPRDFYCVYRVNFDWLTTIICLSFFSDK
jgi:hypothetical protein